MAPYDHPVHRFTAAADGPAVAAAGPSAVKPAR